MTYDRIKVSKEFHLMGSGVWLSIEGVLGEGDVIETEFKKMDSVLTNAFSGLGGETYSFPIITEPSRASNQELHAEEDRIKTMIADIQNCTAIDEKNGMGVQVGLLAFEEGAKDDVRVREAYLSKYLELNKNKE